VAIFIVLALVYWHGRSLSFGGGDSSEHVVSCITWGIPHAPGYPLYTLSGHLFSKLPFGTPEGNVSWFSGVCQAAAAAFLFLLMRRFKSSLPAALTSAGLAAFAPLYWYYAEVAEVRALNNLLAVLAVYFAVRVGQTRSRRDLWALAAVVGLGVGHHPTYVLILPAIAYWLWRAGALPRKRQALHAGLLAVGCCALPYIVLGIRVHSSPPIYNIWSVQTWGDIVGLFMRQAYGDPWRVTAGSGIFETTGVPGGFRLAMLALHVRWLTALLWSEAGPAGLILAGVGGVWLARHARQKLCFLCLWAIVGLGTCLLLFSQQLGLCYVPYVQAVTFRFYLMPLLAVPIMAGFGVQWVAHSGRPLTAWVLMAVALLPFIVNPVNLRGRDAQLRYGFDILADSRPGDFIIVTSDAAASTMHYLDYVQHRMEGRVLLVPAMFASPAYVRSLKRRHPEIAVPHDGSGAVSLDWRTWRRSNPGRRFCSEALFPLTLAQQLGALEPHGVLAVAPERGAPRHDVRIEARRFLEQTATGRISSGDFYPRTPDVYLLRIARLLLGWYDSALEGKKADAVVRDEIRRRFESL
jgi:hypothetical protein